MKTSRLTVLFIAVLTAALVIASSVGAQGMREPMAPMGGMEKAQDMKPMRSMGGMMPANAPVIPAVAGYAEGQDILFIHTEASDAKIARVLTEMMGGSPVFFVPSLGKAPKDLRAPVYVFTNGKSGDGPAGPLGGQADIFERLPGDAEYSPLRAVTLVTWKDEKSARTLKSATELRREAANGAVTLEESGVVVNMPLLTWPGGRR